MAAGAAALLSYLRTERTQPPVQVVSAPADLSPNEARPERDAQSALDQAKAQDLAESLQRLERAGQERDAQARQRAAEEAERRSAAAAAREREEQARDAARHETVMRELERQGLGDGRRRVQITMYSTEWCGACKQARAYMQAQNIAFTERDVERDAAARVRAHALNPQGSVPTITIDQELLIGFSGPALEDRIARATAKRRQ